MIAMDVNDVASVRGGVAVVLAKAGRLELWSTTLASP
jgi:hypothetical protein